MHNQAVIFGDENIDDDDDDENENNYEGGEKKKLARRELKEGEEIEQGNDELLNKNLYNLNENFLANLNSNKSLGKDNANINNFNIN
jgi:hypothetical protein